MKITNKVTVRPTKKWNHRFLPASIIAPILCFFSSTLPLLSQDIIWYGTGNPANTGILRTDPIYSTPGRNIVSLFPNGYAGNTVTVRGDGPQVVYGALALSDADNTAAVNNNVTFLAGKVNMVYGGSATSTDGAAVATGNSASVSGGEVTSFLYGGDASTESGNAMANGNTISIVGGKTVDTYGGSAASTSGNSTADNNHAFISAGSANLIYGGYAFSDNATATATGNTVSISGGAATTVSAGIVTGDANADASGNTLLISGGEVDGGAGFIACGSALSHNGSAMATGNRVIISGGEVKSTIYGGYAHITNDTGKAIATGNTVTLSGTPIFASGSGLYGGDVSTVADDDAFTGNTLNVWNYSGNKVASVREFHYYNFLLPDSLQPLATDTLTLGNGSGENSVVTGVNIMGGDTTPQVGDVLSLINATSITGAIDNDGTTISGQKGAFLLYDFQLAQTTNAITAKVVGKRLNPQSKTVSEGRAASLAFIRQGQDVIVNSGFAAAAASPDRTGGGWSAPAFFSAVDGGHSRYKTGSHVDIDGFSALLGLAWRNNGPCGSLLLGAFFETGYADYDTSNVFALGTVRGDGDSRYFGGGVMARYDWQNGVYVEATGRAGGVKNEFHSDLAAPSGERAKFSINSPYFGAHAGVGYRWRMDEKAVLDLSAKYLWSRQNSDSAIITGSRVHFASDDSHRVRMGARLGWAINEWFVPYIGAAFEYEFRGKARGGIDDYSFGIPSLKGGVGVGEIGLAARRGGFSADFGVQGHVGRRDGVVCGVRIGWAF